MDTLVLLILLLLLDSSLEHRFVFALLISRCWKRDNKWISRNDLREGINCPSNNHINVLPWHHKRYFFSTLWDVIVWIVEVLIRRFWNVLLSIWLFLGNYRSWLFRDMIVWISQISIILMLGISINLLNLLVSCRFNLILFWLRILLHLVDSFIDSINLLSPFLHHL